jgi:hypothetical protein
MDLVDLVLELFMAAQGAQPGDGPALERAMTDRLHGKGIRLESIPGGSRLYGFPSQSGLAHQLDLVAALDGADAIVELKAHPAAMPKDGLLRFKAATDDYFVGLGRDLPNRPIYRVFGGPGRASQGMRRYAALHGIALVEGDRWSSCTLASDRLQWPIEVGGPSLDSRRLLERLIRPMQEVMRPVGDGYLVSRWPGTCPLDAVLDLQDDWSLRLWAEIDRGLSDDDRILGGWAA